MEQTGINNLEKTSGEIFSLLCGVLTCFSIISSAILGNQEAFGLVTWAMIALSAILLLIISKEVVSNRKNYIFYIAGISICYMCMFYYNGDIKELVLMMHKVKFVNVSIYYFWVYLVSTMAFIYFAAKQEGVKRILQIKQKQ